MYSDEYDLEQDLNYLDDALLEPVEHTLQPLYMSNQAYAFDIPKNVKNVKSIYLQFELDDYVLSKEDKDNILNCHVNYDSNIINLESTILILLTQQICRGYNIIENDNNLIIPIISINDRRVNYRGTLYLYFPAVMYKKYKIKVIVKEHLRQQPLEKQCSIYATYSYGKDDSKINEVSSGYMPFFFDKLLYFGMIFYISSKNENVDPPLIDSITLKNVETGEELEYTSENMLCIEIWDYHIYIISFIKEHSTIEKLVSYMKNPNKIEGDVKEYGLDNKTTYLISNIKSLDDIDNNDIHCLKLGLRLYNVKNSIVEWLS
jgi:hypothetical protein